MGVLQFKRGDGHPSASQWALTANISEMYYDSTAHQLYQRGDDGWHTIGFAGSSGTSGSSGSSGSSGTSGSSGSSGTSGSSGSSGTNGSSGTSGTTPGNTITVAATDASFTTISGALASITDSSISKKYTVQVYPGIYIENNPLPMKPYVDVISVGGSIATVISASVTSSNLITMSSQSLLQGFSIGRGCTSASAIFYGSVGTAVIEDCLFVNCQNGITVSGSTSAILLCISNGAYTDGSGSIDTLINVQSGRMTVSDFFIIGPSVVNTVIKSSGTSSYGNYNGVNAQSQFINTGILVQSGSKIATHGLKMNGGNPSAKIQYGIKCINTGSYIAASNTELYYNTVGVLVNDGAIAELNGVQNLYNTEAYKVENSGSNSALNLSAVQIKNSTLYDINQLSSTSTIIAVSCFFRDTMLSLNPLAKFYSLHGTDDSNDTGIKINGPFAVGSPENPSVSLYGEGASYTRGMKVYTFETGSGISTYTDVTNNVKVINDGLSAQFPNNGVDNAIYVTTTLQSGSDYVKHYGIEVVLSTAASYGSTAHIVAEYYSSSIWKQVETMGTQREAPHNSVFNHPFNTYTDGMHIRYNWQINNGWTKFEPSASMGSYYWVRFRISGSSGDGIITSPVFDQIKIHANKFRIGEDGFIEWFGLSRPIGRLPFDVATFGPGYASGAAAQNFGITKALTTTVTNARFTNGAADAVSMCTFLPYDMDTSCPIRLTMTMAGEGGATAANTASFIATLCHSHQGDDIFYTLLSAPNLSAQPATSKAFDVLISGSALTPVYVDLDVATLSANKLNTAPVGDLLWLNVSRPTGDDYTGDVTVIQFAPFYTRWCGGGHILAQPLS